jgi:hypothetical protein
MHNDRGSPAYPLIEKGRIGECTSIMEWEAVEIV